MSGSPRGLVVHRGARALVLVLLLPFVLPSAEAAGPTSPSISLQGTSSWSVEAGSATRVVVSVVNAGLGAADVRVSLVWRDPAAPEGIHVEPTFRDVAVEGDARRVVAFTIQADAKAAVGVHEARFVARWEDNGAKEATLDLRVAVSASNASPTGEGDERPSPLLTGAVAGAAGGAAVAGLLAFLLRTRDASYLSGALLAPLYSRIRRAEVLDQEARRHVYEAVRATPGIRFSELRRQTGLANGALYHHLRKLEEGGLIASGRIGAHRAFAPAGQPIPHRVRVTEAERRVLEALPERGASVNELAGLLGVSRQGASQHLSRLEEKGFLSRRLVDGAWRYFRVKA